MELTPYQQFLYELKDQYPVISLYGCYDAEGNFYESVDDNDDESIQEYIGDGNNYITEYIR